MPRANRYILPGYVDHLIHRCHDRTFLLRLAKDRVLYRRPPHEAAKSICGSTNANGRVLSGNRYRPPREFANERRLPAQTIEPRLFAQENREDVEFLRYGWPLGNRLPKGSAWRERSGALEQELIG
jgi:hypothetical protein